MSVHPRLLLKGCAALLALLLSALAGPRGAVGGGEDGRLRAAPAVERALPSQAALPAAAAGQRDRRAGTRPDAAGAPPVADLPAPSRRRGSAGGPRAPC